MTDFINRKIFAKHLKHVIIGRKNNFQWPDLSITLRAQSEELHFPRRIFNCVSALFTAKVKLDLQIRKILNYIHFTKSPLIAIILLWSQLIVLLYHFCMYSTSVIEFEMHSCANYYAVKLINSIQTYDVYYYILPKTIHTLPMVFAIQNQNRLLS